jgi:hypothetical protein
MHLILDRALFNRVVFSLYPADFLVYISTTKTQTLHGNPFRAQLKWLCRFLMILRLFYF